MQQVEGKKRRRSGNAVSARDERGRRGQLKDLNPELLAEVFSYLPSEDLVEVMLVSKHWERSAREGSGLCRRVTVARKWEMGGGGGKGHNFMCKVLAAAEEVEFLYTFEGDNEHIESVGGVLGSNLQFLEIPHDSVSSAFFPILVSQCPHLKTLLMHGEPKGRDPIDIRHPQLETLMLACQRSRVLTIDCPNLTHLSTGGTVMNEGGAEDRDTQPFPSFNCPRLTDLFLSPVHCTVAVWNFLAAHAPSIKWLQVQCSEESPLSALRGFKAVQALRVKGGIREIPPDFDFGQWPLLEGILLNGNLFSTDLKVRHASLKDLRIVDPWGCPSPQLDCPFLEELWLRGERFEVDYAKNLDSWCPRLKRVRIERLVDIRGLEEVPGLSEFFHETVEELACQNLLPEMKRIACPKLTKLAMRWSMDFGGQKTLFVLPVLEGLNLLHLEIHGYHLSMSNLPSLLALLPDLEALTVSTVYVGNEKDAVLEHSRIKDFVLTSSSSSTTSLVLIMPSLVHVDLGWTLMEVLKVFSMAKTVAVDFDRSDDELMVRRRVFPGGKMKKVDLSDAK